MELNTLRPFTVKAMNLFFQLSKTPSVGAPVRVTTHIDTDRSYHDIFVLASKRSPSYSTHNSLTCATEGRVAGGLGAARTPPSEAVRRVCSLPRLSLHDT